VPRRREDADRGEDAREEDDREPVEEALADHAATSMAAMS
jgi:hypothetical protein